MNQKQNRKGFTLIEMIISLGIFMLFLTAIFGTYIQITGLQQKTNLSREAIAEAREVMTFISEEVKDKAIDYTCYADLFPCVNGINGNTVEEISLISKDGLERTIIKKIRDSQTSQIYLTTLNQSRTNTANDQWIDQTQESKLHSDTLAFNDVIFQITPNLDPFSNSIEIASRDELQYQPVIHVNLNVARPESKSTIVLETSISSRIYNSF
jgi:prepilin-type N-terminal cleavage/methylation domain-containing protein